MPKPDQLRAILESGDPDAFIGVGEDLWFEAKQIEAYGGLSDMHRVLELVKDVTGLANAEGGYIVLGLDAPPADTKNTDEVVAAVPMEEAQFDRDEFLKRIRANVHPSIAGLDAGWVASQSDPNKGLAYIVVPEQPQTKLPILMKVVELEGKKAKQIVFGISQRKDDVVDSWKIEDLHTRIQQEKFEIAQRLSSIDERLARIECGGERASQPPDDLDEMVSDLANV